MPICSKQNGAIASVAALALIAGAANSFTTKVLLQTDCDAACTPTSSTVSTLGIPAPPQPKPFSKPVFATAVAFAAMGVSVLWPLAAWLRTVCRKCSDSKSRHSSRSGLAWRAHAGRNDGDVDGGRFHPATEWTKPSQGLASLLLADDSDTLVVDPGGGSVSINDDGSFTPYDSRTGAALSGHAGSSLMGSCGAAVVHYAPLLIPTLFDLAATALQSAAVLFISAGINAALRGTLLLFSAWAAWAVGSKDGAASRGEWLGIVVATAGTVAVGVSALLDNGSGSSGSSSAASGYGNWSSQSVIALGIGLSTLSNVVQGLQVAYETRFLEGNRYTAMETNGVEGILGVAISIVVLCIFQFTPAPASMPGADNGHVEDTANTLCCLSHTPSLVWITIALFVQFGLSTSAYMLLSYLRGGNFRSLLMVARGALVWGVELACYYYDTNAAAAAGGSVNINLNQYGVPWTKYGWLAALGFLIMGAGGCVSWVAQSRRQNIEASVAAAVEDDRGENDDEEEEEGSCTAPAGGDAARSAARPSSASSQNGRRQKSLTREHRPPLQARSHVHDHRSRRSNGRGGVRGTDGLGGDVDTDNGDGLWVEMS